MLAGFSPERSQPAATSWCRHVDAPRLCSAPAPAPNLTDPLHPAQPNPASRGITSACAAEICFCRRCRGSRPRLGTTTCSAACSLLRSRCIHFFFGCTPEQFRGVQTHEPPAYDKPLGAVSASALFPSSAKLTGAAPGSALESRSWLGPVWPVCPGQQARDRAGLRLAACSGKGWMLRGQPLWFPSNRL